MTGSVERILADRRRTSRWQRPLAVALALAFHLAIVASVWLVPDLLAKPPQQFEYVPVMVVSPAVLGIEEPQPDRRPPPPEPPPPEPPPPEPEPEEPEPEPDVPVLVQEESVRPKPEPRAERKPPPPAPPPPPATPPPKREGSPFGKPLGHGTSKARLGAEDPDFTYGYYLDRVVAAISANWTRPPVGGEVKEAHLYFRIRSDGVLSDLRLVGPSGSEIFDQAAYRAVEASSPLPPLPKSYKRDSLGINLIVR